MDDKPPIQPFIEMSEDKEHVLLSFSEKAQFIKMSPVEAIKLADAIKEAAIEILRSPVL